MNKRYEQNMVSAILTLLTLNKIIHAHIRNTGSVIRRPDGSLTFGRSMFSQKGVPDILAWKQGEDYFGANGLRKKLLIPYAIEVKAPDGYLRPEQKEWLLRFEHQGGVSIVARRLEDVALPMGIKL